VVSDTVSRVKGARLGDTCFARGLIGGAAAIIVVGQRSSPGRAVVGPSADERRIEDLQRLSHAVDVPRAPVVHCLRRRALCPSSPPLPSTFTTRLPTALAADHGLRSPAYELQAWLNAAQPEDQRHFWWHDAGCFASRSRP
jgi:hypothetical protein